jgi:hypothetical protein
LLVNIELALIGAVGWTVVVALTAVVVTVLFLRRNPKIQSKINQVVTDTASPLKKK